MVARQDTLVFLSNPHPDWVWAVQGVSWTDIVMGLVLLIAIAWMARSWVLRHRETARPHSDPGRDGD